MSSIAIFIDAENKEVKTVKHKNLKDLQEKVKGPICFAMEFPKGETMYVNDEGLYTFDYGFNIEGGHQPFAGNAIIVGKEHLNEEGEYADKDNPTYNPSIVSEWVKNKVTFGKVRELI